MSTTTTEISSISIVQITVITISVAEAVATVGIGEESGPPTFLQDQF
jgi:hypothetical protein